MVTNMTAPAHRHQVVQRVGAAVSILNDVMSNQCQAGALAPLADVFVSLQNLKPQSAPRATAEPSLDLPTLPMNAVRPREFSEVLLRDPASALCGPDLRVAFGRIDMALQRFRQFASSFRTQRNALFGARLPKPRTRALNDGGVAVLFNPSQVSTTEPVSSVGQQTVSHRTAAICRQAFAGREKRIPVSLPPAVVHFAPAPARGRPPTGLDRARARRARISVHWRSFLRCRAGESFRLSPGKLLPIVSLFVAGVPT